MSNLGNLDIMQKLLVFLGLTDEEMSMMCPDCPKLNPLNDPEGMKSIHEALTIFNKNVSNQRIFVLQEVGRIKIAVYIHTHLTCKSVY